MLKTKLCNPVKLGPKIFEFTSFKDWVQHATRRYAGYTLSRTIAVDQDGQICGWGEHFMIDHRNHAYPIEVFWIRRGARVRFNLDRFKKR